jgi:hypothetical protein
MKEQFTEYLRSKGYSEQTPSGHPSTVYDYPKRIDNVCKWESVSWRELGENIEGIILKYDVGGEKEHYGNRSNRAVINALKRFSEFLSD